MRKPAAPSNGLPADNLRRFAPPERELEAVAGRQSLQMALVPVEGATSAKVAYRQASRVYFEVSPDRVVCSPEGERTWLRWYLSPEETASLGGTLLDTFAQPEAMLPDGRAIACEPIPVRVLEPLSWLGEEGE